MLSRYVILFALVVLAVIAMQTQATSVADRMRERAAPKGKAAPKAAPKPAAGAKAPAKAVVSPQALLKANLVKENLPPYDPFGIHEQHRQWLNQHRKDLTNLAAENARRKKCGKKKIKESTLLAKQKKAAAGPPEKPARYVQHPIVYNQDRLGVQHEEYDNVAGTAVFQRRAKQRDYKKGPRRTKRTFTPTKPFVGKAIQDESKMVLPVEALQALPVIPAPAPHQEVKEDPLDMM